MLEVLRYPLSPLDQNTRVVLDTETLQGVVIDPAEASVDLLETIKERNLKIESIWLTHSHFDHCGGVAFLKRELKVPLYAHPDEKLFRANVVTVTQGYGIATDLFENCPEPEYELRGAESLKVGNFTFKTLFTPGHAPGHIAFYCQAEKVLISGDTLFSGSIGRTDLPFGDTEMLLQSIREKILTLHHETRVMPGHGPDTTVGREVRSNPFLN